MFASGSAVDEATDENVAVFALDYDGCLANGEYIKRILYACINYQRLIKTLADKKSNDVLFELTSEIQAMLDDVLHVDLSKQDIATLRNDLYNHSVETVKNLFATSGISSTIFVHDFLESDDMKNKFVSEMISEFRRNLNTLDESILDKIIIHTNQILFDYIYSVIKNKNYKKMILVNFSNRQYYELDAYTMYLNGTGSCFLDLVKIGNEFKHRALALGLDIEIEVSDFSVTDFHADLKPGTTFKRVIDQHKNPKEKIEHATSKFDETKGALIYPLTHHFCSSHPHGFVDYYVFDDMPQIIFGRVDANGNLTAHGLHTWISSHLNLFPLKCNLYLRQYRSQILTEFKPLSGEGAVDENYPTTVKEMIAICSAKRKKHNDTVGPTFNRLTVDIANELDEDELLTAITASYRDLPRFISSNFFSQIENHRPAATLPENTTPSPTESLPPENIDGSKRRKLEPDSK